MQDLKDRPTQAEIGAGLARTAMLSLTAIILLALFLSWYTAMVRAECIASAIAEKYSVTEAKAVCEAVRL